LPAWWSTRDRCRTAAEHINAKVVAAQAKREPVISVNTKKKELVGNYKNAGSDCLLDERCLMPFSSISSVMMTRYVCSRRPESPQVNPSRPRIAIHLPLRAS
jgi:hypothetical protein